MIPLIQLLQTSTLTEGAKRMAETDPHGWTLTLIAVTTVFSALVILFFVFTLVGKISMKMDERAAAPKQKKVHRKKAAADEDEAVAAAIALALEAENGGEIPVAISTALAMYLGSGGIHDAEPFIITIKRKPSAWDDPALNFRKHPVK